MSRKRNEKLCILPTWPQLINFHVETIFSDPVLDDHEDDQTLPFDEDLEVVHAAPAGERSRWPCDCVGKVSPTASILVF
jgi:hypothetical protein